MAHSLVSPIGRHGAPFASRRLAILLFILLVALIPLLHLLSQAARDGQGTSGELIGLDQSPATVADAASETAVPLIEAPVAPPPVYSPIDKPELVMLREEFARHYDLGDGRRAALVSQTPLNYQDEAGDWQPVQAAFVPIEGGYQVVENSLRSTLSLFGTAIQLESGGTYIGWQPQALEAIGQGESLQLATPLPAAETTAPIQQNKGLSLRYEKGWSDATLTEQIHSAPGSIKQELLLSQPPLGSQATEWLSLRATLLLPPGAQFVADGLAQSGDFVTEGALALRSASGRLLLTFAPPLAYEQDRPGESVRGRYQVVRGEDSVDLLVQTPWSWWIDERRQYPAVLDPTMQVIRDIENATIDNAELLSGSGIPDPFGAVYQSTCVGHFVTDVGLRRGYSRGYVRFPLPTLPQGATPDSATFVAVPDGNAGDDPTYHYYNDNTARQYVYLHEMDEDWSHLLITNTVPFGVFPAMKQPAIGIEEIRKPDPGLALTQFPAQTWDVSAEVQAWYTNPSSNFGFALVDSFEAFLFFEDLIGPNHPTFTCYPTTAQWSDLDDVMNNPGNPTADGPGLGLLIYYTAPAVPANVFMNSLTVPSANPVGSYKYQYQEYALPVPSSKWQLVATQGAPTSTGYANTPLTLADDAGNIYIDSDGGSASPGNASQDWQPNYVVVNGYQPLPADLRLRVQPDNQPSADHNDKRYHLQTEEARAAPGPLPVGISTTVPITLFREMIEGQALEFAEDTTIEIRIPYSGTGLDEQTAEQYDLQVFPAGLAYGSRTINGASLTRGPDAYEIEFSIPPGQAGTWLLVLQSNQGRRIMYMDAQVTACANTDDIVQYPLDGVCVQLHRPPPVLTIGSTYQEIGELRLYSPAGFIGNCLISCTTDENDSQGTPMMPLLGYKGEDDRWVALKSGTFTLDRSSNKISTTPNARLLLADFADPNVIVSMPVIRGEFEAQADEELLSVTSAPPDTWLLVKSPMHPLDDDNGNGWDYEINLRLGQLRGFGTLLRTVRPTASYPVEQFDFNGDWTITAHGGPSLQGLVNLTSVTTSTLHVGTLLVTAAGSGYTVEHNPAHATPANPGAIPQFLQLRFTGATVAQPANLGAAKLAVQGVMLPPGQSVKDEQGEYVVLECGVSCFDLRAPADAMLNNGPLVDREYSMPDLIVQDSANTVMFNTAQGVEIYSSDHPLSRLAGADDLSFNYEAYSGSVRTFRGLCPGARDPLDPDKQSPDGPMTTVVVGTAGMILPNAGSDSGDVSGAPEISVQFTLCEGSLREMKFTFSSGDLTAIPVGSSGMFLNFIGGTISITPKQPGQAAFTTVVLDMRYRGMSPQTSSSILFSRGVVTIDSRGLFDVQVQTGIEVFAGIGAGMDGHFWVAWSPLDLGFEVAACAPYSDGFDSLNFPGSLCDGDELLVGTLRAHMWQGQGWQHKYDWLPDDGALHVAARFEASVNIPAGIIVDWGPAIVPPATITLAGVKLAFGEFCTNGPCTTYEWGVMGALVVLGYDLGAYYGFDSGISFFVGSNDYLLIDEAGLVTANSAGHGLLSAQLASAAPFTVTIPPGLPSAMFGLAWTGSGPALTLTEPSPGNRTIDKNSVAPDVTVDHSTTSSGVQTILVIDDPLPGVWTVDRGNTSSSPDHRFFYFANNPAPSLTLGSLPTTADKPNTIPISWTSTVSDPTTARLSLYYERTTYPLTTTQDVVGAIVERIPLTASGVYSWELDSIPSGSYKVFARIDSTGAQLVNGCGPGYSYDPDPTSLNCNTMLAPGVILPVDEVYAQGGIRIRDNDPPAPPVGVNSRAEGISNVVVLWSPNLEQDLGGYIVTCLQGATFKREVRVPAQIEASAALSETARVNGLNPQPATCTVQAYDTSFNLSAPSAASISTPSGNIPLPPAPVTSVNVVQLNPTNVTLNWAKAQDASGYVLVYNANLHVITSPFAQASPFSPAGVDADLTGGYQANEGPSPINVGDVTSFSLTGLRPGTTYEAWVRPYDDEGRFGLAGAKVKFVVPVGHLIYLPFVAR